MAGHETAPFDCVVVGAGIQGSFTALHLVRAGKRTLIVDQFEQGHTRGSSHGGSRLIRSAYKEAHYARLMPPAYKAWQALEEIIDAELIVKTGLVYVSTRPPHTVVDDLVATMTLLDLPYEVMDGCTLNERWSGLDYGENTKAFVDPSAGLIKADVALKTVQELFVEAGGEIKWEVAVQDVVPGNPVVLQTSSGDISAASVVLCLGPWAPSLISPSLGLSLPLKPRRIGVMWCPEKTKGAFSAPGHPVLIDEDLHEYEVFAMPALEFPGHVKCGYNGGSGQSDPEVATNDVDEANKKIVSEYLRKYVPAIEPTPSETFTCFYTMTPDENFILDKHPEHKNIVIGAGFSGTGFKLGPVVGHILANLAMDLDPPHDISEFRISRFT